jgi:hypothetical protein
MSTTEACAYFLKRAESANSRGSSKQQNCARVCASTGGQDCVRTVPEGACHVGGLRFGVMVDERPGP